MQRTHDERRMGTGCAVAVVLFVVMLPALYFASLGPVAYFLDVGNATSSSPIWDVYSYPGQLLYDAGYGDWLSNYVEWWVM